MMPALSALWEIILRPANYTILSVIYYARLNLLHFYGQAKMTTLSKNKMKDDTLNVVSGERETEPSDCE